MIRKAPIVIETPFVPGTPGRAEQLLCQAKAPASTIPDRGQLQRFTFCYQPRTVVAGMTILGPEICVSTWGPALGQ